MEKKQPIIVKMNQDQLKKANDASHKKNVNALVNPPATKKLNQTSDFEPTGNNQPKKLFPPFVKVILFAGVSAVAIGLLLGFIMLHMFSGMGAGASGNQQLPVTGGDNSSPGKNKASQDDKEMKNQGDKFTLPGISVFVLQGGIFSESANAKQAKDEFESAGYPALIWQKDGQYFLLAGIAATNKEAKNNAEEMKKKKLDVYAKEWSIANQETQMTKEEHQWVLTLEKNLVNAVENVSNGQDISNHVWAKLEKELPKKSDRLKTVGANVSAMAELDGSEKKEKLQQLLLEMLKNYQAISVD